MVISKSIKPILWQEATRPVRFNMAAPSIAPDPLIILDQDCCMAYPSRKLHVVRRKWRLTGGDQQVVINNY
jgi:hypothetical protein